MSTKEMYEVYEEAMIDYLTNDLKVSIKEAERLILRGNIKQDFISNPGEYEMLEPEWVAKVLYDTWN